MSVEFDEFVGGFMYIRISVVENCFQYIPINSMSLFLIIFSLILGTKCPFQCTEFDLD